MNMQIQDLAGYHQLHIRHKAEFFSKKNKKSSTKTQKQKFILTLRLA